MIYNSTINYFYRYTMLDAKVKTFLTVCETKNFTKAATLLNLSQPAVSVHIRALEEWYGTKLFAYEGKKLLLTADGERLQSAMSVMWNDLEDLRLQLDQTLNYREKISFGATVTIGEYIIAQPLARFIRKHREADVRMEIANTQTLCRKLKDGEIQFAFVEGAFDVADFDSLLFKTVPFVPICAGDHQFATPPRTLKDLLSETLILREKGSGTRNILEETLAAAGLRVEDFASTIEISSMHTITELVTADLGISFMFRAAAQNRLSYGAVRELVLKDFSVARDFRFIWQKGSVNAGKYEAYCEELSR